MDNGGELYHIIPVALISQSSLRPYSSGGGAHLPYAINIFLVFLALVSLSISSYSVTGFQFCEEYRFPSFPSSRSFDAFTFLVVLFSNVIILENKNGLTVIGQAQGF